MKKRPPSFLDIMGSSSLLAKAPLVVKGAVYDFLFHWYRAGCRTDYNIDYRAASGIVNQNHWDKHKQLFIAILTDLMPQLALVHADDAARLKVKREAAARALQGLKNSISRKKISEGKDKQMFDSILGNTGAQEIRSAKLEHSRPKTQAEPRKPAENSQKGWFVDKKPIE